MDNLITISKHKLNFMEKEQTLEEQTLWEQISEKQTSEEQI